MANCARQREAAGSFIQRALKVHGGLYDYSRTVYATAHTKLEIVCRTHGSFWQLPNNHMRGMGCAACNMNNSNVAKSLKAKNEFVAKARILHGEAYDYASVDYQHSQQYVKIVCRIHGIFKQKPAVHLYGKGCYECGMASSAKNAYNRKPYVFQDGQTVMVQGYEPWALGILERQGYKLSDLVLGKLLFTYNDGHKYYPDIFIPDENRIVEVKSPWTYKKNQDKNYDKAAYAVAAGYGMEFWVFDQKQNLTIVPFVAVAAEAA